MTTLTKRMAEDLTDHLLDAGIKVNYMHSDTATMDRVETANAARGQDRCSRWHQPASRGLGSSRGLTGGTLTPIRKASCATAVR